MAYKVFNAVRLVRAFDTHEAATGYLVSYIACAGGAGIMLSPPEAQQTSVLAERITLGRVNVEVFGSASNAERALSRKLYPVPRYRVVRVWAPSYAPGKCRVLDTHGGAGAYIGGTCNAEQDAAAWILDRGLNDR